MKFKPCLIAALASFVLTLTIAPACFANEYITSGDPFDASMTPSDFVASPEATAPTLGEALSKESYDASIEEQATSDDLIYAHVGGTQFQSEAYKVLGLINAARARVGVAPLTWDNDLAETAMNRSGEITVLFQSDHARPNGNSCFSIYPSKCNFVGENIAYGYWSASDVNNAFTNSSGHYANMVDPDFNIVGIACFIRDDQIYWVESFGSSSSINPVVDSYDGRIEYMFYTKPAYINNVYHDVNSYDWFVTDGSLQFVTDYEIMAGYTANGIPNGKFGPNDSLTRGQIVTMIYRFLANTDKDYGSSGFVDVPDSAYYAQPVAWAKKVGVINGSTYFRPNDPVTREELAKMLASAYVPFTGRPLVADQNAASRLSGWSQVSDWAKPYVAWAVGLGIFSSGNLNPHGNASRSQAAKMMRVFSEALD